MNGTRNEKPIPTLLVCLMGISPAVYATDFDLARHKGQLFRHGNAGTLIRSDDPNPENYALIPSSTVPGATTGRLMGQTGGSDLNYSKGKPRRRCSRSPPIWTFTAVDKKMGVFTRVNGVA